MRRSVATATAASLCLALLTQVRAADTDRQERSNRVADLLREVAQSPERAGPAAREEAAPPIIQWLNHVPAEPIDWQDKPFTEIIEWLADREQTGAPVEINIRTKKNVLEAAGVDAEYEVTLKLSGLPLRRLLTVVLDEVGGADPATRMGFHASDGVVTISTEEDLNSRLYLKAYDVTDIVLNVPDFTQAPEMDVANLQERQGRTSRGGGGGSGSTQLFRSSGGGDEDREESKRSARMDKLVEVITTTIDPESWEQGGGLGRISYSGSMLIVYNSLEVHQRIQQDFFGGVRLNR